MNVLDAYVREWPATSLCPDLYVLFDRFMDDSEFVWNFWPETKLFWAEQDGVIRFFYHDASHLNLGGLYGDVLTLRMADGSTKTVVGPWSAETREFWERDDRPVEPISIIAFSRSAIGDVVPWWSSVGVSGYYLSLDFARHVIQTYCAGYQWIWSDERKTFVLRQGV